MRSVIANLDQLVDTYNQCLQNYRWFDRELHKNQMSHASYDGGTRSYVNRNRNSTPDGPCPEITAKLKYDIQNAETAIRREAFNDDSILYSLKAYVERMQSWGDAELTICKKQIAVCQEPSRMGRITDYTLDKARLLPTHFKGNLVVPARRN